MVIIIFNLFFASQTKKRFYLVLQLVSNHLNNQVWVKFFNHLLSYFLFYFWAHLCFYHFVELLGSHYFQNSLFDSIFNFWIFYKLLKFFVFLTFFWAFNNWFNLRYILKTNFVRVYLFQVLFKKLLKRLLILVSVLVHPGWHPIEMIGVVIFFLEICALFHESVPPDHFMLTFSKVFFFRPDCIWSALYVIAKHI